MAAEYSTAAEAAKACGWHPKVMAAFAANHLPPSGTQLDGLPGLGTLVNRTDDLDTATPLMSIDAGWTILIDCCDRILKDHCVSMVTDR